MKSRYLAAFAAVMAAAFVQSDALAQSGGKSTVRVGILLPLTGNTAWAGKTNRVAAQIAADEVNAQDLAGGYKLDLVFGDSQCEPRVAHDQAQRLISQEKADVLIGEWCSSASIAAAQVANDEKIPLLVNISTADNIAKDAGPYSFQSSMQNRYVQQREAAVLDKAFKFQTVAVIVENNDFGLTFRKNMVALMEKAGKKVVLDVTQDRNDTNWYATITRIPAAKPDLVIVSISAGQAANFVKQYAEAGITTPLFSDYPPPPNIFERQVGAQAAKIGLVRAAFFLKSDTNTPAQKEFTQKLEARVLKELNEKHDPTHWDVASYDAVRIVADALKRGGAKSTGFLQALAATRMDLVMGHYEFDAERGVKPEGMNFVFIRNRPDGTLEVVQ
jgi:branched-chain amino acid transport system substrate-binding protein